MNEMQLCATTFVWQSCMSMHCFSPDVCSGLVELLKYCKLVLLCLIAAQTLMTT